MHIYKGYIYWHCLCHHCWYAMPQDSDDLDDLIDALSVVGLMVRIDEVVSRD